MTVHCALMLVYVYCGMFDKAGDMYQTILEDGVVPDATMYGCLMKFAVECGRTELAMEISKAAPAEFGAAAER